MSTPETAKDQESEIRIARAEREILDNFLYFIMNPDDYAQDEVSQQAMGEMDGISQATIEVIVSTTIAHLEKSELLVPERDELIEETETTDV